MKTYVIIPAAGAGVRLNSNAPKALVKLKGKEILLYSLEIFEASPLIDGIVIAAPGDRLADFETVVKSGGFKKTIKIIAGGKTRSESVYKALETIDPNIDFVMVHDAARPLISLNVVENALRECYGSKAIVVAVPVKSTVKRTDYMTKDINATLDRSTLWEAQTPQIFSYELLNQAHRQGVGLEATDDSFLVERFGAKVRIFEGEYRNIKITTPEDLKIAETLLS